MATPLIDPRQGQLVPDILGAQAAGLQLQQQRELAPLQLQQQQLGLQQQRGQQVPEQSQATLDALISGANQLKGITNPEGKIAFIQEQISRFKQGGLPTQGLEQALAFATQGNFEELETQTDRLIALGQQLSRKGVASAKAFAPDTIRKVVGKDEKGKDVFGLFSRQIVFDPATKTSRVIETPIEGELVTSTGETISQQRRAEVTTKGLAEESKAVGKALGEFKTAPLVARTRAAIETAVKLAVSRATAQGETLTDLARAEAALPGLRETIGQLKELAPIATSTLGGRVFDIAVKESGFGSTKGANARAKFIAIINNQVLPLLKQTFGAAFTEREGETLKATMGDPNATPEQKIEQLNSFINQKVRDIQSKERELGQEVTVTEELRTGQPLFSPVLNRNITEQDIQDTLNTNPDTTREQLLQQLGVQ